MVAAAEPHTRAKPKLHQIDQKGCFEFGPVNGASVWHVNSGMGSAGLGAAQQTVTKAIEALRPDAVILVGIAFGMELEEQQIGDVLVSQRLMMYESQRVGTKNGEKSVIQRGDRATASPVLLDRMRNAHLLNRTVNVWFGLILSGEKLVDNRDFRQELLETEPESLGGEMEGAGLYTACVDARVPWIVVKGICDWGDGHKGTDKKARQELAAKNAAKFVLDAIAAAPLKLDSAKTLEAESAAIKSVPPASQPFKAFQIAHLYWLGSDLADAYRITITSTDQKIATRCLTQSLRHFKKARLSH